jgi:hypothetical protein
MAIASPDEFEEAALDASGFASCGHVLDGITKRPITDSRRIAVDPAKLVPPSSRPLVVCHTSGTSGGAVKWFHMAEDLVHRLWAPGMQAIFESSGVTRAARVAIFVPSRLQNDGLVAEDGSTRVRLYSAEFSQRLMLALLRPAEYLLDVYRTSRSLTTLARLLALERIDVVSAPAATVLGWADRRRLRQGLRRSFEALRSGTRPTPSEAQWALERIRTLGVDAAAVEFQRRLKSLFAEATLVFSTSSLTAPEWAVIRRFMGWTRGAERFTNLYVGSETGPFAATLRRHPDDPVEQAAMAVFPLTLPAIQRRGAVQLLSRSDAGWGRLLVSRMHVAKPVYNLDTGDVVQVTGAPGAPTIADAILRAPFPWRVRTPFTPPPTPTGYDVYVGGYFDLGALEVVIPRRLQACLAGQSGVAVLGSVLYRPDRDGPWVWRLFVQGPRHVSIAVVERRLASCPEGAPLASAARRGAIRIEVDPATPLQRGPSRVALLGRVGDGTLPKGALKRWPLYLLKPSGAGRG